MVVLETIWPAKPTNQTKSTVRPFPKKVCRPLLRSRCLSELIIWAVIWLLSPHVQALFSSHLTAQEAPCLRVQHLPVGGSTSAGGSTFLLFRNLCYLPACLRCTQLYPAAHLCPKG